MTALEKLDAGLEYRFPDKELAARKLKALKLCREFNRAEPEDEERQQQILKEFFGSISGTAAVQPGFNCDKNIHVGKDISINYNMTLLASRQCVSATEVDRPEHTDRHGPPSDIPMGQRKRLGKGSPVTIGNDVWIGGNCVILPGVIIGNDVVVGAGMTKDAPDNFLVAGVPARIVRELPNDANNWSNAAGAN